MANGNSIFFRIPKYDASFVMFDGRLCLKKYLLVRLRIKKSLSDFVSYFCFFHNLFPRHLQTTLYELRYGETLRIHWNM
jgi:hypothetical protein